MFLNRQGGQVVYRAKWVKGAKDGIKISDTTADTGGTGCDGREAVDATPTPTAHCPLDANDTEAKDH